MRCLLILVALVACSKKSEDAPAPAKKPPAIVSTVGPDGVRSIAIEAGMQGYVPDTIPGTPGEKLTLVFTRTVEGECLEELRTPEGTVVKLPMKQPVAVAVTVPASGELTFACGMDMFRGKIVSGG